MRSALVWPPAQSCRLLYFDLIIAQANTHTQAYICAESESSPQCENQPASQLQLSFRLPDQEELGPRLPAAPLFRAGL